MLKIEYIEALQERIPRKVNPGTLNIYIGRAWNQIIYKTFRKNFSDLDIFTKTYSGVAVDYDSTQDIYYSKLPVPIIQLPMAGDGVLSIHSEQGKTVEFVPNKAGLDNIQYNLEVSTAGGPISYYLMNNRVEYGRNWEINQIQTVRMRVIPQFEQLDMMEEIFFPVGSDEQMMELVINMLQGLPPIKETNDNSTKTP